jgi:hypothetical protein
MPTTANMGLKKKLLVKNETQILPKTKILEKLAMCVTGFSATTTKHQTVDNTIFFSYSSSEEKVGNIFSQEN